MREQILEATIAALDAAAEERFYRTERGYHGRFYCRLQAELDARGLLRDGAVLEMEYQKSGRHGMTQRPDIVFHIPTEHSGGAVTENNFAVFALKRRATPEDARDDFRKLDQMIDDLKYELAVFINVDAEEPLISQYDGPHGDRMCAFAVKLLSGGPRVFGTCR